MFFLRRLFLKSGFVFNDSEFAFDLGGQNEVVFFGSRRVWVVDIKSSSQTSLHDCTGDGFELAGVLRVKLKSSFSSCFETLLKTGEKFEHSLPRIMGFPISIAKPLYS